MQAFGLEISDNDPTRSVEFRAIIAIAGPREGAQPLLRMGLGHGGAGAHDLTSFTAEVAGRTHLGQPTAWLGKLGSGDESPLTGSLTGGVNIEDEEAVAGMINEPAEELSRHAMRAEVVVKLLAQGVQAGTVDVRQKAAEGGAVGQLVAPEERHEGIGEGAEALEEGLESRLAAEGIAKQDGDEVDHVIGASATAAEVDLLGNGVKDAALRELTNQQDQFSEPRWNGGKIVWAGVDVDRSR